MAIVGSACLIVALVTALYGVIAALYGARARRPQFVASARRSVYALALLLTVAMGVLELAYLRSDFSFSLVASNSSTTTPDFYKLTALWSSQPGSLLLWVWILSLFSSAAMFAQRKKRWELLPYANAILLGLAAFFTLLLVFFDSPFAQVAQPLAEGNGLNPLLRHPSMMFHPPSLYIGYVGLSIPFAFAIGALITRRFDAGWLKAVLGHTLLAWMFLGFGILLGARWSYAELGWGGYWAWDPVENASLMPWLVGTAFLHSAIVQQRRGMLKIWNISLIIAAFSLALLGTFLVRSGILSSIHAFGESTVGTPFLVLIGVVLVGSVALLISRLDDLRSERKMGTIFSRESIFLINNLLLVGLCFVIFWGTFFPLIAEVVTGKKASLGPPWYDQYTTPLAIALVLFSGIGPLLAWGGSSWASVRRIFLAPAIAAASATLVLVFAGVTSSLPSLLFFAAASFAVTAVVGEFWRGAVARRTISGESVPVALASILQRNRRRYGGYVAHLGVVILLGGVAASSAFQHTRDVRMAPGDSAKIDGYTVRYKKPTATVSSEKINFGAVLSVTDNGRHTATLYPSRSYFPGQQRSMGPVGRFFGGESTSEVGMRAGAFKDIWTAMQPDLRVLKGPIREANRRFPNAGSAVLTVLVSALAGHYVHAGTPVTFRLMVSPLVTWLWIGGLVVVIGALIGLWPATSPLRRRTGDLAGARLGRSPSRA